MYTGWSDWPRRGPLRTERRESRRPAYRDRRARGPSVWLHVQEQAAQRFTGSGVVDMAPAEQLRKLTELLLAPSHDHRVSRVWLALAARAAHDPQIAALHREQWIDTEELLDRVLARANPARAAESADAAAALLTLLDGLSISVLTEPDRMPPERAARIGRA